MLQSSEASTLRVNARNGERYLGEAVLGFRALTPIRAFVFGDDTQRFNRGGHLIPHRPGEFRVLIPLNWPRSKH